MAGYFDHVRDGFGPVAEDHDGVLAAVERQLASGGEAIYRQRAEDIFPFRDGRCCERVFEAILELDRPHGRGARSAE